MPKYKEGKSKPAKGKMSYPMGDGHTKTMIPNTIKPPKKVNYTHNEGK